jgi:phage terminase large subunit GpA-like protein
MDAEASAQIYRAGFLRGLRPEPQISTAVWAETYRRLSRTLASFGGLFRLARTPYLRGILDAIDDLAVWKVVAMKSAQVGWTDGVLLNYLGRRIHRAPCPIVVLFPKDGAAREFASEKFSTMVELCEPLRDLVRVGVSRAADNRQQFKRFPGGFLKLVGSNSPSSVKSTPAPVVAVEEPDDCQVNVRGQGNSLQLLEERTKTFARRKMIIGGTPSVEGASAIAYEYEQSDRRRFFVPCVDCREAAPLVWEHVKWQVDEGRNDPVYGDVRPDSVRYGCPACGSLWDDAAKRACVGRGEWVAAAPFHGVAGFHLNELLSSFPGSALAMLVGTYLQAQRKADEGDDSDLIVFRNATLGLPYAIDTGMPEAEDLAARALDYPEGTVPRGGVVLTCGVDVQHDRLAVVVRAWGENEESWLVLWTELYGTCTDRTDAVWTDLDTLVWRGFPHVDGPRIYVQSMGLDAGDGATSDAVYHYVRTRRKRGILAACAVKGASWDHGKREIYTRPPPPADPGRKASKAAKYGLRVYLVGTHRAKDLLFGRVKLGAGRGAGRLHWYAGVRADYCEQLMGEVPVPLRGSRGQTEYRPRAGVRHEALDCEVYALHGARRLRLHLRAPEWWAAQEQALLQAVLPLGDDSGPAGQLPLAVEAEARETPRPPPAAGPAGGARFRVRRGRRGRLDA